MRFQFTSHADGRYSRHPKVVALSWLAKMLGVLIHIEGLPYGSARNVTKGVGESLPSLAGLIGDSGTVL